MTPRLYHIPATLRLKTVVTVQARTADEALQLAAEGEWQDDGREGGELKDWDIRGEPQELIDG